MGRVVALFLAVLLLILGVAFLVVSCGPGEGPPGGPGTVVEVDIDAPKKHKPAYKAPKYGKGRR